MNKTILTAMTIAVAVFSADIASAEKYALVQNSDCKKTISYEVMTESAFKELAAKSTKQSAAFSKAIALAEKSWREDATYKAYSFPKSNLAAPKAVSLGTFDDETAANNRKAPLQKKIDDAVEAKKSADDRDAKKEAEKKKKPGAKKTDKKDVKLSMDVLLDKAADLVTSSIDEVMAAAELAAEKPEEVVK